MSHPLPERVKKSVRLDIRAIAIISDYAAKHGCNETDALNMLILATQEPDTCHPLPPTTTYDLLVDRVLALETQMLEVVDRIDRDKTNSLDTGLELAASDRKISCESSRDLDKGGTSSLELVAIDLDVCRAIIAVLKPHPESGYYFRSEYLGQIRIKPNYRQQAIKMGFSYEHIDIDGKSTRVWLNKDYKLQATDT